MTGNNCYLVTALPSLGDLGTPPPISLRELRDHLVDSGRPLALVDAILLGGDLVQRQAFLSGEIKQAEPVVLTVEQLSGDTPLPQELDIDADIPHRIVSDSLWQAYFHNVAAVAKKERSKFMSAWLGYEVALKNALAAARAKALDLDSADYLVAPELSCCDEDFTPVISEWAAASTPLEGLRVLDRVRWEWLIENDSWFSFSDDEIAAYAAKLMLLVRWRRLSQQD